jgi:hypothetical protein
VKVAKPMRPYLPYHVLVGDHHRIVYFVPIGDGRVEWRGWFSHVLFGIGTYEQRSEVSL